MYAVLHIPRPGTPLTLARHEYFGATRPRVLFPGPDFGEVGPGIDTWVWESSSDYTSRGAGVTYSED